MTQFDSLSVADPQFETANDFVRDDGLSSGCLPEKWRSTHIIFAFKYGFIYYLYFTTFSTWLL